MINIQTRCSLTTNLVNNNILNSLILQSKFAIFTNIYFGLQKGRGFDRELIDVELIYSDAFSFLVSFLAGVGALAVSSVFFGNKIA